MHDCHPTTEFMESFNLNGDTWKAVVAVRLMSDVEIVVVDIDCGVGVLRRRENKHPLPHHLVEYLDMDPVSMLNYEMLDSDRFGLLRLMSYQDMVNWVEEEYQSVEATAEL